MNIFSLIYDYIEKFASHISCCLWAVIHDRRCRGSSINWATEINWAPVQTHSVSPVWEGSSKTNPGEEGGLRGGGGQSEGEHCYCCCCFSFNGETELRSAVKGRHLVLLQEYELPSADSSLWRKLCHNYIKLLHNRFCHRFMALQQQVWPAFTSWIWCFTGVSAFECGRKPKQPLKTPGMGIKGGIRSYCDITKGWIL